MNTCAHEKAQTSEEYVDIQAVCFELTHICSGTLLSGFASFPISATTVTCSSNEALHAPTINQQLHLCDGHSRFVMALLLISTAFATDALRGEKQMMNYRTEDVIACCGTRVFQL